jgi:hypothetical protein
MIIIGLTGRVGCGKDTAASAIIETMGFEKASFAEPLKATLCYLFGWNMKQWEDLEWKETPNDACFGKTPRYVAQTFGTDWGRNMIDHNIWVELAIRELAGDRIVFTDVRFDNEAQAIRDAGGYVVEVVRRQEGSRTDYNTHSSEAGIDRRLIDIGISAYPGELQALRVGLMNVADMIIQGEFDNGNRS